MTADASRRRKGLELADPQSALSSYLDDLLYTATTTVPAEEPAPVVLETTVPPAPTVKKAAVPVAEKKSVVVPESLKQVPEPQVTPVATPIPAAVQPTVQPPPPVEPEGRPDWSEKPFECLIFRVAGLQLAVPLILLGAIHRIDDRVKPIPGRPPWYMGMLLDRDQNLKVVDTAEWIMAGRVPPKAAEGYRFVIRLDNSDWALACDEVAQSFTLNPEEVRWRSARSKRPWLAGTVIQHMCALIDVGTMARLLARAEREQKLELD